MNHAAILKRIAIEEAMSEKKGDAMEEMLIDYNHIGMNLWEMKKR